MLSLPPHVLSRGVLAASTGNHALAVVHACSSCEMLLRTSSSSTSSSDQEAACAEATAAAAGAWSGTGAAGAEGPGAAGTGGVGVEGSQQRQVGEPGTRQQVAEGAAGAIRPVLYLPNTASPYKVGVWEMDACAALWNVHPR